MNTNMQLRSIYILYYFYKLKFWCKYFLNFPVAATHRTSTKVLSNVFIKFSKPKFPSIIQKPLRTINFEHIIFMVFSDLNKQNWPMTRWIIIYIDISWKMKKQQKMVNDIWVWHKNTFLVQKKKIFCISVPFRSLQFIYLQADSTFNFIFNVVSNKLDKSKCLWHFINLFKVFRLEIYLPNFCLDATLHWYCFSLQMLLLTFLAVLLYDEKIILIFTELLFPLSKRPVR